MTRVVEVLIGLGSNLNDPQAQINNAIVALGKANDIDIVGKSSLYRSHPQGPQDQPAFINAAVLCHTTLPPIILLKTCQGIEQAFGRQKTRHWGERVIDLDILFYGRERIHYDEPFLHIPHPMASERDFVLLPCLEICPEWMTPGGRALESLLSSCPDHGVEKLIP